MKRVLVYGMTDNPGGIESYLITVLEKMRDFDICLDFVTDFPEIAYKERLVANGSRIYYIPAKGKKLFRHWAGMRKILKDNPDYETVYFNLLDAGGVFTAIIAKLMGRNVVVHSHNGDTDKQKLHRRCKPLLGMITDRYMACSGLAAEYMFGEKILKKKDIMVVPNAIEAGRFEYNEKIRHEYRKKLGIDDRFVVCHVGRMTRQKNPFRMIDIFKEVYKRNPQAVLLYIGDGDIKKEVTEYAKTAGDAVKILGTRDDIPEIMQASDVFLLPSLYEGLPIVAIEAQAADLPTVMSTDITDEVGITDHAVYVDLQEGNDKWANVILSFEGRKRKSVKEDIAKAGYDKDSMQDVYRRVAEYLV